MPPQTPAYPPTCVVLDPVKPNRNFNILAAVFNLDQAGNLQPLLPTSVSSISYTVWQLPDAYPPEITASRTISGSGSFVPLSVISASMLTGTAWAVSSPPYVQSGFNANYVIPGSYIPTPNTTYEVQVTITLNNGTVFDDWFQTSTLNVP